MPGTAAWRPGPRSTGSPPPSSASSAPSSGRRDRVTFPRACLIDVYDTILVSRFESRMEALIGPLGIPVGDWLAEWDKLREDRDRGRVTIAASIARTLPAFGIEPEPGLV